jgi:hypothetical protein
VGPEDAHRGGGGWFGIADADSRPPPPTDPPRCSFCQRETFRGVAGPTPAVFICFDCIDLAAEIKAESLGEVTDT